MTRTEFLKKLRRARALIAAGWTQGAYAISGCYCAQGALTKAGIGERTFRLHIDGQSLHPMVSTSALIEWNDTHGRTKEDVLAMFDASIAALRSPKGRDLSK